MESLRASIPGETRLPRAAGSGGGAPRLALGFGAGWSSTPKTPSSLHATKANGDAPGAWGGE